MIYLVYVQFENIQDKFLISASTDKELKHKIEDAFQCIEATKVEEGLWMIKGFDVYNLKHQKTVFKENITEDVYVKSLNYEELENFCKNGLSVMDIEDDWDF